MTPRKSAAAEKKLVPLFPKSMWQPLEKLKPYPLNVRTHPPVQIDMLARIFLTVGPDQPIVVDENWVILKGHGRRLAAYQARMESFPVVQRFGLTDVEKDAMRIEDNQSGLLSGWDAELTRGAIASLRQHGYDISLLGFGEQQLVAFETVPQPPAQFPEFGEDIPVEHECPRCKYTWSGSSAPIERSPAAAKEKKKADKKKPKAAKAPAKKKAAKA